MVIYLQYPEKQNLSNQVHSRRKENLGCGSVAGNPNHDTATVAPVERFYLTTRQQNKRLARKALGYSKSWDNHGAMNSVLIFLYNVVRRHEALRGLTPAQALGITDRRWFAEDVAVMIDAYHAEKTALKYSPAFLSRFTEKQRPRRVYQPVALLVPWYLDKDSGGKNCPVNQRKPGVNYDC